MSKLYILTLNWEGKDKLEKLYPSVINSLKNIDYEWIIKDNGSKDNSVEYLKSFNNNKLKVISYKDNLQNFSQGVNYCFNEASPKDDDYILLLNNDVIFNDIKSIHSMINIMKKDSSVGVVGARMLYTNTDKLQHAGVVFHDRYATPMHFRANEKSDANAEKNRLFQVVTGAVLLTKAEYFKNVFTNKDGTKGMNSNLIWSFDDVDLCLSIKYNMDKKIVYCGSTNIFHEESASLKKNPVNKLFMPHNINYLKTKWNRRYVLDHNAYNSDPKLNLY